MVYGILQMLSPQIIPEEVQLQELNSSQDQPLANQPAEEKLTSLIQQISQELEKLLTPNVMEKSPVDATKRLADPIKLEQVLQQLVVVLQTLGKEQQTVRDKPMVEQLLQQMTIHAQETKVPVKVMAMPLLNGQITETTRSVNPTR